MTIRVLTENLFSCLRFKCAKLEWNECFNLTIRFFNFVEHRNFWFSYCINKLQQAHFYYNLLIRFSILTLPKYFLKTKAFVIIKLFFDKKKLGGNSAAASQTGTGSTGSQATFYNMEKDMENNLLRRINELHRAQLEPLVKFLPLILDKLLLLMVKPPAFDGHILNVGPAAFNAIAMIVNKLTSSVSPFTLFFSVWE